MINLFPFPIIRTNPSRIRFDLEKTIRKLSPAIRDLEETIREADLYLRQCEETGSGVAEAAEIRNELIAIRDELKEVGNKLIDLYERL